MHVVALMTTFNGSAQEHQIASLGTTWNMSNLLMIFTLWTGWHVLESIDMEIKHLDNWLIDLLCHLVLS